MSHSAVLQSSYLGMSAPGLPNFLQIQGPNQWLGHNSLVLLMEAQCRYFTELISKVRRGHLAPISSSAGSDDVPVLTSHHGLMLRQAESVGASTVEVDEAAHHAFAQEMRARLADSVWQAGKPSTCYCRTRAEPWDYGES